jgi:hypothetical protein
VTDIFKFDIDISYKDTLTVTDFGYGFLIRSPHNVIIYPGMSVNIDTEIKAYIGNNIRCMILPIDSITKSTRLRVPYQELSQSDEKQNIILTLDNIEPIFSHRESTPKEIIYVNDNKIRRIDGTYINNKEYKNYYFNDQNVFPAGSYFIQKGEEIARFLAVPKFN